MSIYIYTHYPVSMKGGKTIWVYIYIPIIQVSMKGRKTKVWNPLNLNIKVDFFNKNKYEIIKSVYIIIIGGATLRFYIYIYIYPLIKIIWLET